MSAIPTNTLIEEAKCIQCYGSASPAQLMRMAILRRILLILDPMASVDPQSLITYANCFQCHGWLSIADMMELALMDQISQAVSGWAPSGTGTAGLIGNDDPEGSEVADPGTTYWAINTQTLWVKQTGVGNTGWVQVL